jgi:hypothetical protein
MKTYGPLYGGTLRYWHKKAFPIIEVGHTQEAEFPYRKGHCLVFRAPFTETGFYAGLLFKQVEDPHLLTDEDVDVLLSGAMRGRTAWTPEDGLFDETFLQNQDELE